MKALLAMALTAALTAAPAYADYPYPAAPTKLPDDATAAMQDMIDGQNAVKGYDKAINDYVSCIDKELDDSIAKAGKDLKPEQKKHMQELKAQKHNAAIDELQGVATRFNEQVKIYKARTANKKG